MTSAARILVLILGVATVIVATQYSMNHWSHWSAETKANVWVAVGTILLAVATFWSVWETRLVIRGEDRRHQQTFAPFLLLQDNLDDSNAHERGYTIYNIGSGVALNVAVEVVGCATISTFHRPPGIHNFTTLQEQEAFVEKHSTLSDYHLRDVYSCSALAEGREVFFRSPLAKTADKVTAVGYSSCSIRYQDMFGNRYETRYTDDRLDGFEWIQPESLRVPG